MAQTQFEAKLANEYSWCFFLDLFQDFQLSYSPASISMVLAPSQVMIKYQRTKVGTPEAERKSTLRRKAKFYWNTKKRHVKNLCFYLKMEGGGRPYLWDRSPRPICTAMLGWPAATVGPPGGGQPGVNPPSPSGGGQPTLSCLFQAILWTRGYECPCILGNRPHCGAGNWPAAHEGRHLQRAACATEEWKRCLQQQWLGFNWVI